ncbi:MAG: hypothetical protein PVF17_08395 [Ignavibacteria bacterium]|jgi:hypothetical protein
MIDLDSYISLNRRILTNVEVSAKYEKLYNMLIAHIKSDKINVPKFKSVFSINRFTEILECNSEHYLIYDQYLGYTYFLLTEVYLLSKDNTDSLSYFYKIMAEFLQLRGELKLSLLFALLHSKTIKPEWKDIETNLGIYLEKLMLVQDCFTIAHELMHLVFIKHDNKNEMLDGEKQFLLDIWDGDEITFSKEDAQRELGNAFRASQTNPKNFSDYSEENLKRLEEKMLNKLNDTRLNEKKILESTLNKVSFLEETQCDYWAAHCVFQAMKVELGLDIYTIYNGVQLALQNLSSLKMLEQYSFSLINDDYNELQIMVNESNFRILFLHLKMKKFFSQIDEKAPLIIDDEFSKVGIRYTQIIMDPLYYLIKNKVSDINKEYSTVLSKYEQDYKEEEFLDSERNKMIDQLLGNKIKV